MGFPGVMVVSAVLTALQLTVGTAAAAGVDFCRQTAKRADRASKGIGVILEVEVEDDQIQGAVQLTDCNFDPRCENLPTP